MSMSTIGLIIGKIMFKSLSIYQIEFLIKTRFCLYRPLLGNKTCLTFATIHFPSSPEYFYAHSSTCF
nr:MAG TPA: hypothetical protein [Caudoviricetes sp.]